MSKDLRFNKEDFFFWDEVETTEFDMARKTPKHIQADVKNRSRGNHLRWTRKRSMSVENETEKTNPLFEF